MTAYEWAVSLAWIVLLALAIYLEQRRLNRLEIDQAREEAHAIERLRDRLTLAETIVSLPEHELQRLQRVAEPLGFLDSNEEMPRRTA